MIITKNENFRNSAKKGFAGVDNIRLRPNQEDAIYIKYWLGVKKYKIVDIAMTLTVSKQCVQHIIAGRRRSRKVEAEIARLLGKESWNDVVIEARLAVSNPAYRPTAEDIEAYKDTIRTKLQQVEERKAQIRKELAPMREAIASIKGRRRG